MGYDTAVHVEINVAHADDQALDHVVRQLRNELLNLDVNVSSVSDGPAPPDTKGLDLTAVGQLLVQVGSAATALTSLVKVVQSWLGRKSGGSVKLTIAGDSIEIVGDTSEDQHRLIEQWIDTHAGR